MDNFIFGLLRFLESKIFHKKELANNDNSGSQQFAKQMVHAQDGNEEIQQSCACDQSNQTCRIKGEKALDRFISDLEVILSVEEEAAEDTAVVADNMSENIV